MGMSSARSLAGRALKVAGWIWIGLASLVILASLIMIAVKQGFWEMASVASPLNVINLIVTVVTLLPGILLIVAGERISGRAASS